MASTLFKALENIEKGRQACITGARNHGHDVKDTATLQQLADTIFDIGDHIKNTLVPIPELEETYTFDITGKIINKKNIELTYEEINNAILSFKGEYNAQQIN